MEDIIILGVLAVAVVFGIRSGAKHFKGEGGCCGGGSTPVKKQKKKLEHVITKRTVTVEGMVCENCKNRVEKCINEIEGAAAKVNLSKKEAVVSMEKEISDEQILETIKKAGYQVTSIR